MNCDEFLSQRSGVAHKRPDLWPLDLQQHLSSCSDCARLESYLGNADDVDIHLNEIEVRVQKLIAADLTPVKPIASAPVRTLAFVSILAPIVAGVVWILGAGGWAGFSSGQAFAIACALAILVLIAASELSGQMVPAGERRFPSWAFFGICLLSMPVLTLLVFPAIHDDRFVARALRCWEIGTGCALLMAPLLWVLMRRGFPVSPYLHLATAGLLAGLAGITVLELHCPIADGLHKAIGHGAVALTAAIAGGAVGLWFRRLR